MSETNNSYFVLLTNAGAALQTNAWQGGDKINLTHFVIGSNNNPVSATQTEVLAPATEKLVINELKQKADDTGVLEVTCIIEPSVGGFMMNSIGLYTDAGVLFAVANLPSDYKPVASEGSSKETVITLYIALGNVDTINLTIDPYKVLATQYWVENEANIVRSFNGKTGDVTSDDLDIPVNNMTLWLDPVNGDDNNDGLTPFTAMKDINKTVKKGINSFNLEILVLGDLVLKSLIYFYNSSLVIKSVDLDGNLFVRNLTQSDRSLITKTDTRHPCFIPVDSNASLSIISFRIDLSEELKEDTAYPCYVVAGQSLNLILSYSTVIAPDINVTRYLAHASQEFKLSGYKTIISGDMNGHWLKTYTGSADDYKPHNITLVNFM